MLTVLTGGIAGNVLLVKGENDLIELIAGGALVTLVGLVAVESVTKRLEDRPPVLNELDHAADALADAVGQQWERAALERGLIHPTPVTVRWRWAAQAVAGPASDAVSTGGAVRFPPLAGMTSVSQTQLLEGRVQDLFAIYAGLDSGRLFIIGGPGTGKSAAATMLINDALKHRRGLVNEERDATPVPILLSCTTWNPIDVPFETWVADQIMNSYRFLRAAEYGANAAEHLVRRGRVAIMLDGFDEASVDLQPKILAGLNGQARCRLIVLSRDEQLIAAARREHLAGAAALQLQPITRDDASEYLARCRVQPPPEPWRKLVEQIKTGADPAVAEALNKPLTLSLVRDTFHADADAELLGPGLFTTSAEVEEFLLDRVIPAAYRPRPGPLAPPYTEVQAARWLGYIASQMSAANTHDLAWWRMPTWKPPAFRAIANGLLAALVFTAVGWITFGLQFAAYSAVGGLIAGTIVGAFAEWRPEDRPVKLAPLRWRALGSPGSRNINLIGIVTSVGYGTVAGIAFGLAGGPTLGVVLGVGVALAFQFSTAVSILTAAPYADVGSPVDPMTGWRRDRDTGFVVGTAFGVALGVLTGVSFGLVYGLVRGFETGMTAAIAAGIAISLTYVRTWEARLAFIQICSRGQGPARMMRFLADAHRRGVLRSSGPVFQFRHSRLRDRLAEAYNSLPAGQ
ncbi:hypothetical protein [Dactylosporangium sp. NPDC006015]|uniref:NACHT domain-containing protein n=1 Tax=Dactylosporangium sp. NPDC006015 TaxID=3154576 RepID=UPI0033AD37A5